MERIKYKNGNKLKGIVDKVFVSDGDSVVEGQPLAIISTQGEQYEVLSHVDGIIKNVYIIESLLVSHGDIIFDIYNRKSIEKIVSKETTLGDTLRFSLKKAGYIGDETYAALDPDEFDIDPTQILEETKTEEDFKENTMRFKQINDNNENNEHGDIPTEQYFNPYEKTDEVNEEVTYEPEETEEAEETEEVSSSEVLPKFKERAETLVKDLKEEIAEEKEQAYETFVIPESNHKQSNNSVNDDEEFMKKALENAVKMDSLTQVIGEENVIYNNEVTSNLTEIENDLENNINNKTIEYPVDSDVVVDAAEDKVDNDKSESSGPRFSTDNHFLNTFSENNDVLEKTEEIFKALNRDISSIEEDKKSFKEIDNYADVEVDTKELNRIEDLLETKISSEIASSNLKITEDLIGINEEYEAEIKTTSPKAETRTPLLNDETGQLRLMIKNNTALIKDLSGKVENLMSEPKKMVSYTNKDNIGVIENSHSSLTFETNVTALLNLNSILQDSFSEKGMDLNVGMFISLAALKSISSSDLLASGVKLNLVDGTKVEEIAIIPNENITLTEMAEKIKNKDNDTVKTDVLIYDFSRTAIKIADIATNKDVTFVIGKVFEDENLTATISTKVIFNKNNIKLDEVLKIAYTFNGLIENPGYLI